MAAPQGDQRVSVHFEVDCGYLSEKQAMPFVIGVLADFSKGRPARRLPLHKRKFLQADRDNFDDLRVRMAPGSSSPETASVGDDQVSASWRGLWRLVNQIDTGVDLKVRILDVSRSELMKDLSSSTDLMRTSMFQLIHKNEMQFVWGGSPYGLLVVDFDIASSSDELRCLAVLAEIASLTATGVVVTPSPQFFGLDSFTNATSIQLSGIPSSNAWQCFRDCSAAKFVSLAFPRFEIEPNVAVNAGWIVAEAIGKSVARYGWPAKIDGELNQMLLAELRPEFSLSQSQVSAFRHNGISVLSDDRQAALSVDPGIATCDKDFRLDEILCAAIFQRYVLMICRYLSDGIVVPKSKDVECAVQNWLEKYRVSSEEELSTDARRPLHDVNFVIKSERRRGIPFELSIRLGYQFEQHPSHRIEFAGYIDFVGD